MPILARAMLVTVGFDEKGQAYRSKRCGQAQSRALYAVRRSKIHRCRAHPGWYAIGISHLK
jgi:hypothetical protein